jgi:hypothetical protein
VPPVCSSENDLEIADPPARSTKLPSNSNVLLKEKVSDARAGVAESDDCGPVKFYRTNNCDSSSNY